MYPQSCCHFFFLDHSPAAPPLAVIVVAAIVDIGSNRFIAFYIRLHLSLIAPISEIADHGG